MDWFKICTGYYSSEYYDNVSLKAFVVKGKITAEQYLIITGIDYIA